MKKLLFITLIACIGFNLHAQNADQAMKTPLNKKTVLINKEITPPQLTTMTMPDRTLSKITPVSSWKPLPQFQVEQNKPQHWYALENADNLKYWQGVNVDKILICLKKGIPESELQFLINKYSLKPAKQKSMFPDIMNFFVYDIPEASKEKILEIISEAKTYDNIEFAEPDIKLQSFSCTPNDPYFASYQWGPYNVWADSAWCYTTGTNTTQMIAVIDNAVDYTHSDLGNVSYGYDYGDNDNDPYPVNASVDHGTHVCGISSARINNSTGIAGMANDTVYFAKVTTDADPGPYDYAACINALNNISTIARIRAVNMSWGGPSNSSALQSACDNAWNNGKLLIAAAGNDAQNGNPIEYPAAYNSVMAVAALDANNSWSTFSNHLSYVEVSAPGGSNAGGSADILSTLPGNSYDYKAGTSMAAPLVTGLAGLMFAINPNLTNVQARTILQQCVFDRGTSGWDEYYGYGEVCAFCAVIRAQNPNAIEENSLDDIVFGVFPVPSKGLFTVQFDKLTDNAQISVINNLGQEIYTTKSNLQMSVNIDLSAYANGIYFVKIYSDKKIVTKKIILNR